MKTVVNSSIDGVSVERDESDRVQTSLMRYERDDEVLERVWTLHWHTQDGFRALAESAGLHVASVVDEHGRPAEPDARSFAFWLTAALLMGAFCASLAATEGGGLRDGTWSSQRRLTPALRT